MNTKLPQLILAIILTTAASSLPLQAEPEIKGSPTELAAYLRSVPGNVELAGEGEVKVSSDQAVLSLRINTESKNLSDALKENQQARANLMKYLEDQKIRPESIKPAPFSAIPKTSMFSDKVKSYKLSAIVKVTTTNETEFNAVARAVDEIAEVEFEQSEFEHSKKDNLSDQALREACEDVERQKRIYEAKLGVKLVPRNIRDHKAGAEPLPGQDYGDGSVHATSSAYASTPSPKSYGRAPEMSVTGSTFGELVFKARVTVQYAVEQK
jgi:uncharacterized protein YggE